MQARLFHLHALSALHCGTGQSVGVVDLPIARARATQLPIVPGSSLRGVLRQQVEDGNNLAARTLFGPRMPKGNDDSFAGALAIADAHLLVMPVRCLAGIVSYVTSPFILNRYARDLDRAGTTSPKLPPTPSEGNALVPSGSVNRLGNMLVLEDLDLSVGVNSAVQGFANRIARTVHPGDSNSQDEFVNRFALVPDEIMSFLAETATEIRARVAIDRDTGVVSKGALWYEENLPADSVMWGVFALSESFNEMDKRTENELVSKLPTTGTLLQLGGKSGVGRGLVRFFA